MRLCYLTLLMFIYGSLNGQSVYKDTTLIDITIVFYDYDDNTLIGDYDIFLIHGTNDTLMNRHINDTLPVQFFLKDTCDYTISLHKYCYFFKGQLGLKSSGIIHIPKNKYKKTIPHYRRIHSTRGCCLTHQDSINFTINQAVLDAKNLRILFDRIKVIESQPKWKFKIEIISLYTENKLIPDKRVDFLKNTLKSLEINSNNIEYEKKVIYKSDPDYKNIVPCIQLWITSTE